MKFTKYMEELKRIKHAKWYSIPAFWCWLTFLFHCLMNSLEYIVLLMNYVNYWSVLVTLQIVKLFKMH